MLIYSLMQNSSQTKALCLFNNTHSYSLLHISYLQYSYGIIFNVKAKLPFTENKAVRDKNYFLHTELAGRILGRTSIFPTDVQLLKNRTFTRLANTKDSSHSTKTIACKLPWATHASNFLIPLGFPKNMEALILHSIYKYNSSIKHKVNTINSACLLCYTTVSEANTSNSQPAFTLPLVCLGARDKLSSSMACLPNVHFPLINQLYTKHMHNCCLELKWA